MPYEDLLLRVFFDGLCEPPRPLETLRAMGFVVYRESSIGERKVSEDYRLAAEPGPDSTHKMPQYT